MIFSCFWEVYININKVSKRIKEDFYNRKKGNNIFVFYRCYNFKVIIFWCFGNDLFWFDGDDNYFCVGEGDVKWYDNSDEFYFVFFFVEVFVCMYWIR